MTISLGETQPALRTVTPAPFTVKRSVFIWFVFLLVALAILRSALTTCLDGFTIDEAYHIAAGVS